MEQETSFDDIKKILARTAEITERNAKLIGDLGNKFGSFTEGMAFPSMEKVLRERFGMTTVTTRYKTRRGSDTIEIDVLGIANGDINTVVVVEVKSHLKHRDIDQMLRILNRFTDFFPSKKVRNCTAFWPLLMRQTMSLKKLKELAYT
ncbi:hypothetical protein [Spirosoma jeollabukense]